MPRCERQNEILFRLLSMDFGRFCLDLKTMLRELMAVAPLDVTAAVAALDRLAGTHAKHLYRLICANHFVFVALISEAWDRRWRGKNVESPSI